MTEEERFIAAVHAGCDDGERRHLVCTYPACGCSIFPKQILAALKNYEDSGWQPVTVQRKPEKGDPI